jgi:Recombinase
MVAQCPARDADAPPLPRGEIVWNQTQKRDVWGTKRPTARAEREWIRREVSALRIVPENLWRSVQARLAASRAAYVTHTGGSRGGRPPTGIESKYLHSPTMTVGTLAIFMTLTFLNSATSLTDCSPDPPDDESMSTAVQVS